MSAGRLNLLIEAGATFNLDLTWQDENEDPIDITGYAARMQLRTTAEAENTLLDLTSDLNGGITLGGVAGTIAIRVGADITDDLPTGRAVYDLELVAPGDPTNVERLVEGSVTVHRQVTR